MRRLLLIGLVVVGFAAPARAEDLAIYDADGDADAAGADPRVAALDEAFARAVAVALADVLDAEVRKTNKAVIDKEIIGRARLWVAKFKVKADQTTDGRRQLAVAVSVDRDKMRARLGELNIGASTGTAEAPPAGARTSVVLLRVAAGDTMRATYGASAEKDIPGLGAIASLLRGGGFAVKRAPAGGAPAKAAGDLPLEDDEAEALADAAKADVATVAGVLVGPAVPVRGQPVFASLVTAHVRVIARGKKLVGQGSAAAAARGTELPIVSAAIDRALAAAASDALPVKQPLTQPQGFQGDDTPIGEPGVVLLRLSPKTPYALVAQELKHLTGARGVSKAVLRRLSPGGWVIGVTTTESIERIASIARKPPAADTSAQAKIVGDVVEVALTGAP